MYELAIMAKSIPHVRLFHVELLNDEVFVDNLKIYYHLKGTVHVARVAKVLETDSGSSRDHVALTVHYV